MTNRRIAMWSGPRNISTALLRSWGSRGDTYVVDEPLYAYYLRETGLEHPAREEVLASQSNDWREVVSWLTGDIPEGRSIFYQKHMAHHLLPTISRDWLSQVTNALLIRDPGEMLTSLARVTPNPTIMDTGLPQQVDIFRRVVETGVKPPVVDARDILEDPRAVLPALCFALEVPFDEAMLSWEPGPRPTDGVWAPHWYAAVEASSGFAPYQPKNTPVPNHLRGVLEECRPHYNELYRHRLTV